VKAANIPLPDIHTCIKANWCSSHGKSGMATTGMTSIFPHLQRMLAGKGRDHSSSLLGQPGSRLASAWCSTQSEFHQFHWRWWRLPPGIAYRLASDLHRMTWDSAVESTQSNETLSNKTMAYLSGLQYRILPRNINLKTFMSRSWISGLNYLRASQLSHHLNVFSTRGLMWTKLQTKLKHMHWI